MTTNNENSDNSDEWDREDIPDFPTISSKIAQIKQDDTVHDDIDDDDTWEAKLQSSSNASASLTSTTRKYGNQSVTKATSNDDVVHDGVGESMIIVNMTMLSNGTIHSKFDIHSVNDPTAVKLLRATIEQSFTNYAKNLVYIQNKTIIPCGTSIWKDALAKLRKDNRNGDYYCPIFPPK